MRDSPSATDRFKGPRDPSEEQKRILGGEGGGDVEARRDEEAESPRKWIWDERKRA